MSVFAFFFVPLAAFFFAQAEGQWPKAVQDKIRKALLAAALIIGGVQLYNAVKAPKGIGLVPNASLSAEFFKAVGLSGPVFSNYDIGGYLIYHLADREKVFVDNRQEAFPPGFFKDVYIPMQEDGRKWSETDAVYGFNVIYFYRHDLTPWGQKFLVDRIDDPLWAPVFVDDYTIIFLKRNEQNAAHIARFGLPRSMFAVHK